MGIRYFQTAITAWVIKCFGHVVARDKDLRNYCFLEEALELVQACGMTRGEVFQQVNYTFGRPVGDTKQEVGGVMVMLAELIVKIRAKQATKPKRSPLPGVGIDELSYALGPPAGAVD